MVTKSKHDSFLENLTMKVPNRVLKIKNPIEVCVRVGTCPGKPFLISAPSGCGKSWAVCSLKVDPDFKDRVFDGDDFAKRIDGKWIVNWESLMPFEDKIIIGYSDNWLKNSAITSIGIVTAFPLDTMIERKNQMKNGIGIAWVTDKNGHIYIINNVKKNSDYIFRLNPKDTSISYTKNGKNITFYKFQYTSYISFSVKKKK